MCVLYLYSSISLESHPSDLPNGSICKTQRDFLRFQHFNLRMKNEEGKQRGGIGKGCGGAGLVRGGYVMSGLRLCGNGKKRGE